MLTSPRARKLAVAAATLGLTAGLVPHAMALPLLGDILPGTRVERICSNEANMSDNSTAGNLFDEGLFGGGGVLSNNSDSFAGDTLNGFGGDGDAGRDRNVSLIGLNGSLNGLSANNISQTATNNSCSVASGNTVVGHDVIGGDVLPSGLFGGPLFGGPINILSGGNASDGGNAGNGGGNIMLAPLTGIGINQCTTVSVLLGLGSDAGCSNGLGIINMFNGFGGF